MTISLEVDNFRVAYGNRTVIADLSLQRMVGGQVVGLLGPNAAGKSSLLQAIAGVSKPAAGRLTLTVDNHELAPKQAREAIGYVPQDLPKSAALTSFETIVVAGRRRQGAAQARLRAAEIMTQLDIAHLAGTYLSELSGGQQQMVALAQMLVTDPAVLLLDEPTSALDLQRQLFVLSEIRRRVRDTDAVAVVAIHDINLAARFCDELVVIQAGEVRAQGRPEDVLTAELLREVYGVRAEIIDHQGVPVICAVG
ncbi:ABC transporter ATP-binding protein [Corynebacterium epidermidicanis]|uniref:ABC transporter ATP-binding protein n=1 Tax=Corynebacterium epidermidicanis TaxID=1050174 RepID=UPI000A8114A4|nr:ABC transporter ATP-binding protein [Corynebacterium epidermidicanis]